MAYKLLAVLIHSGTTRSGHYWAYVRTPCLLQPEIDPLAAAPPWRAPGLALHQPEVYIGKHHPIYIYRAVYIFCHIGKQPMS
jgi:hypothetical protein